MRRGIDLRDATVVLTGASSGIGRAAANRFAAQGANLLLAARAEHPLREAAKECREAGADALAVPTDVTDPDAVYALARRALDEFGRIDVWVNDAAVMAYGTVEDVPIDVQRRILETNLLGTMNGARAVLPVLRGQGRGVIINVASLYGKMTSPYVSGYATSKFGLIGFSQVLRQELRAEPGIHVCTVLPGSMDTPIFRHAANYTGREIKPVPPVSSPERAARAVVRRAKRPRRRTTVGQMHHVASWAHALLPRAYSEVVPPVMRFVAIGDKEETHHEGNLFHAEPELDAVHGGWRHPWKRGAAAGAGVLALSASGIAILRGIRGRARRP